MRFVPRRRLEDAKLEMTPMIDVTFLLLIFFMCTLKFKTLEGALSAYLPDDAGPASVQAEPVERIDVVVEVVEPGTRVAPNGGPWTPGMARYRYGADRVLRYRVGPSACSDLDEVRAALTRVAALDPAPRIVLEPRDGVVHAEAVVMLEALTAAGFDEVTIHGAD